MKKTASIQFSILALVSVIVSALTFFTGGAAKHHWREMYRGGKAGLPELTIFATQYGYLIPLACCLVALIFVVVSIKRHDDLHRLWQFFTFIVTIELFGLALIALGFILPSLRIMYRIM